MDKQGLAAEKFLELLNQTLAEQQGYKEGMAFRAAPHGSKGVGIWGTETSTAYVETEAYMSAERIVHERYEFDPSR